MFYQTKPIGVSAKKRMEKASRHFFSDHPNEAVKVIVIIPVRNEAEGIVRCLNALCNQRNPLGERIPLHHYEVLVLANNCTDNTKDLVELYQRQHPAFRLQFASIFLPAEEAHVGTARRLLMDAAAARFKKWGHANGIIASTDGDTVVDQHWLYHTIDAIKNGCDAVGGRIEVEDISTSTEIYPVQDDIYQNLVARTQALIDPLSYDPWPHHYQFFGASMAVTASMYEQAGGLPVLPFLEDGAFYNSLFRQDARIRRSPNVIVKTSSRHDGRVSIGLSEQLKKWADMEQHKLPLLVNSPSATIMHFQNRRQVRLLYESHRRGVKIRLSDIQEIGRDLQIAPEELNYTLITCSRFGQLWQSLEKIMESGPDYPVRELVPVDQAISILKAFTNDIKMLPELSF
jgi:Glycosyl transferase family 2